MSFYAIEAAGQAFKRTKKFFFEPFNLNRWLKLGLVGILGGIIQQGGGYNCNSGGGGGNNGPSNYPDMSEATRHFAEKCKAFYEGNASIIYLLIGLVILLIVAISLIISYIRANMFIIFMESLIQREVTIMKSFSNNRGKAFSLFLFRIVIGLITIILMIIIFIPLILHVWHIIQNPKENIVWWSILANSILSIVAFVILLIVTNLIFSLTHDFAVPLLYRKETGIIGGWINLTNLILNNPLQFIVYYAIKFGIAIAIGMVMLVLVVPLLIILIPLYLLIALVVAIVGVAIYFLYMASNILGIIAGIFGFIVLIIAGIAMGYVFFCPYLPIYAFFRFYALCFLESIEDGMNFGEAYLEID